MGASMTVSTYQDRPPDGDSVTSYDESHLALYIRLLDAATEGADWREAAQILFGLDPGQDADRARRVHDSHLARARWMTTTGYRDLLRPRVS